MANEILGHGVTVVLVGSFNPAIFSPAWLAATGLISRDDAETSEVGVIHPQLAEFKSLDVAFSIQPDRFQLSTTQSPFVRLADWVGVIFGTSLVHTPITQAGINYSCHFAASTELKRYRLGRALAPLEPWGDWGKLLSGDDDLFTVGGMRSIVMMQPHVDGRTKGHRQVQVEPSFRSEIVNPRVGIFMSINDHYEAPSSGSGQSTRDCVSWVTTEFDNSLSFSRSIVEQIQSYTESL